MDGFVDFNRTWNYYKHGFSNLVGEFWLGLDKINHLTQDKTKNMLRMRLFPLIISILKKISNLVPGIEILLIVLKKKAEAGADATVSFDSLNPHKDLIFGAWDRDPAYCAQKRGGDWWYGSSSACAVWSNLNGMYPHY
ncbi:unnamed protein product [Pocillopora meandrina]|uniref:Fibrinogen C-terminal domain-containing protein n=1 Tax=Pocillopora meandrina TaxID=46732 RepID=A0AAU9XWS2_9CNID|nr:unnamed protein product [Pocillopora meandrina]